MFFLIYCLLPTAAHCPFSLHLFCITDQSKEVTSKSFIVPTKCHSTSCYRSLAEHGRVQDCCKDAKITYCKGHCLSSLDLLDSF